MRRSAPSVALRARPPVGAAPAPRAPARRATVAPPLRLRLVVALVAAGLAGLAGCARDTGARRDAGADLGAAGDLGGAGDGAAGDGPAGRPDLGDGPVCETTTATATPLPSTLLVQVDTSGSMNCAATARSCLVADPTPDPGDSRWDVFRAALTATLAALPDTTRVGLLRYPETFACAGTTPLVPIDELGRNRAAFARAMEAVRPEGVTPTRDAVRAGLSLLRARPATEPRALLLATDGAATVCLGCDATCNGEPAQALDNRGLVEDVAAAASAEGIRTFVLGVPGSESYRAVLSQLATRGGTARPGCADAGPVYCHYDLTDPSVDLATGLRDALATIGGAVIACDYAIPPNPDGAAFDPTKVNVVILDAAGAETARPRRDPTHVDGWDYSRDGARIELHGPACAAARATDGRVEVRFGCPTVFI